MRNTIMLSAAVMIISTAAAFAADLPMAVKAPVAAAPVSWTGCFAGGHLGGAVSDDTSTNALGRSINYQATGFVGGGQIGCDYQFAPNWVIGGEGRAAWTSLETTRNEFVRFPGLGGLLVPSQLRIRNDFLASVTGRLGYVYAATWLVYARGGAAWTREKLDDAFVSPNAGVFTDPSVTTTRTGWTAGAGVEWAFAANWSANVEYNYYDFGTKSLLLTSPTNRVTFAGFKDTIHAATIGVNYHF
ncbi:putative outer membrane protein [Bradyrhizobium sp. STM 3809]|nr:putative outer membrane protein [Bradyrhizobium sp. STM 3809]